MAQKTSKTDNTSGEKIYSVRLEPEIVQLIDDWRRDEPDLPVRSEAMRRMIRAEGERRKGKKR